MRTLYSRNRSKPEPTMFGRWLKSTRMQKGMSQEELAQKIGVSRPLITRLESGEYMQPSPITLKHLAEVLQAKPEDLYAMVGYMPANELPDYEPYLHAKFDLPDQAVRELVQYFEYIQYKYSSQKDREGSNRA